MKDWVIDAVLNVARARMSVSFPDSSVTAAGIIDALSDRRPDVVRHLARYRPSVSVAQAVDEILDAQRYRLFPSAAEWRTVVGPVTGAWLVTWEWGNAAAEVGDRIAAILRANEKHVRTLMWFLHSRFLSTAAEMVAEARRRAHVPYPVRSDGGYLYCGSNPELFGRVVSKLVVSERSEDRLELVEWLEPELWTIKDHLPHRVRGRIPCRTLRRTSGPLSDVSVWDRATSGYLAGWGPLEIDGCGDPSAA